MKCQHRGSCVGFELVWPPLVSSAEFVHIVDTARLRVDGVLFAADAPLKAAAAAAGQQQQTPHLAACDDGLRERQDNDQRENGRDDIPAQVCEFLVDSLQRHFVWVVEVVDVGGWCPRSGWLWRVIEIGRERKKSTGCRSCFNSGQQLETRRRSVNHQRGQAGRRVIVIIVVVWMQAGRCVG